MLQIPEGYRLQLQGLSEEGKRKIIDACGLYWRATLDDLTCIARIGGAYPTQVGDESTYCLEALELTPIYVAEELALEEEVSTLAAQRIAHEIFSSSATREVPF